MTIKETKILALRADNGGCGNYRISNPITELAKIGYNCEFVNEVTNEQLNAADIIIAQRQINKNLVNYLTYLKSQGKFIISEIDDPFFNLDEENEAKKRINTESKNNFAKMLKMSNGIITTTEELKYYYSKYNNNIAVVPNFIDYEIRNWRTPIFSVGENISIGWAGSASHAGDMPILGKWVEACMEKYPVNFRYMGPDQFLEYLLKNYKIDKERTEQIPSTEFDKFPDSFINMCDIMFCVNKNTKFNATKSDLKVIECLSAGIIPIGSPIPAYVKLMQCGGFGYLSDSVNTTVELVGMYVADRERLERDKKIGYMNVLENMSLSKNINIYPEAIFNIISHNCPPIIDFSKNGRNDLCFCGSNKKIKKCHAETWSKL